MRKLILLPIVAALVVPAWALADAMKPSGADRANAAKQCATERQQMGADAFKQLYGTNANKSNANGKCVSALARMGRRISFRIADLLLSRGRPVEPDSARNLRCAGRIPRKRQVAATRG